MECKASLESLTRDLVARQTSVTFRLEGLLTDAQETALKKAPVRLKATQWRERRSLDANAYYWLLVGKIAEALGASATEVHNTALSDYGQLETENGQLITVMLREDIDYRKLSELHLRPTSQVVENSKGTMFRCYYVVRGSHTYDSKEMSHLINGIVSEAKALDIETLPPDELERMFENAKKKEVGANG